MHISMEGEIRKFCICNENYGRETDIEHCSSAEVVKQLEFDVEYW